MSEKITATLAHVESRGILVGSLGRAAFLGDVSFSALKPDGADRDVDVIDPSGNWQRMYRFSDAAPLDSLMTRRLRPVVPAQRGSEWGLFTNYKSDGKEPFVMLSEESLQLQPVELPFAFAKRRLKATTVGGCAQIALHGILRAEVGPNLKHTDQVERLRSEAHDSNSCHCPELTEALGAYHAFVRQANRDTMSEKLYFWTRWALRTSAPGTFKKLQDSKVGQKVREIRGTPEIHSGLPSILELT